MTLQDAIINDSRDIFEERGVKAADIERVVSGYPESFLDEYRKKKSYISSILAKNEVDSKNPYNQALFLRLDRGYYCINPELAVWVDDNWMDVYELTGLINTGKIPEEEKRKQLLERIMIEQEKMKKLYPNFPG